MFRLDISFSYHDGQFLEVRLLLPDLGEALLDDAEGLLAVHAVHQQEGLAVGDRQPPHSGELQVARGVQESHLQLHATCERNNSTHDLHKAIVTFNRSLLD